MCHLCDQDDAQREAAWKRPLNDRDVPWFSGEGAIYSPEYLARREGNANGTEPESWRALP